MTDLLKVGNRVHVCVSPIRSAVPVQAVPSIGPQLAWIRVMNGIQVAVQ